MHQQKVWSGAGCLVVAYFASACSCGSDPDVETNPPDPSAESGIAVGCTCNVHIEAPQTDPLDVPAGPAETCLPEGFRNNPQGFCAGPFARYIETATLRLAATPGIGDPRACDYAEITATCQTAPIPGTTEVTRLSDACQGVCPSIACDDTNCTPQQSSEGTCLCSVPTACGGFAPEAICQPSTIEQLQSLSMGRASLLALAGEEGKAGALRIMAGSSGQWDQAQSSLHVFAEVEVACVPILGCLTASDSATSPAFGDFMLVGAPCPGSSCAVGLETRIAVEPFDLEFSVGPVSESAHLDRMFVSARTDSAMIQLDASGAGSIPIGALSIFATGNNGSDQFRVRNKSNDTAIPITVNWASRTVAIEGFGLNFSDGNATINLHGSFSNSLLTTFTSVDSDGDGVPNVDDNCILTANPSQQAVQNPVIDVPDDVADCGNPNIGTATATDVCSGLPADLTNDAPARFLPGETVVTWTATDAFGTTNTATQVAELRPLLLSLGRHGIDLGAYTQAAEAGVVPYLVALGKGETEVGEKAAVGNIVSAGDIELSSRSTAFGDLLSGRRIRVGHGVQILGTKQEFAVVATGAFPSAVLPPIVPGHADVRVKFGHSLVLAPGAYRDLDVSSHAVLTLTGGTYVFSEIDLNHGATIKLAGDVEIFVRDRISWEAEFVAVGAPRLLTVSYAGNKHVSIDESADVQFIAPYADLTLGGHWSTFTGSFIASSIETEPGTDLYCSVNAGPTP